MGKIERSEMSQLARESTYGRSEDTSARNFLHFLHPINLQLCAVSYSKTCPTLDSHDGRSLASCPLARLISIPSCRSTVITLQVMFQSFWQSSRKTTSSNYRDFICLNLTTWVFAVWFYALNPLSWSTLLIPLIFNSDATWPLAITRDELTVSAKPRCRQSISPNPG